MYRLNGKQIDCCDLEAVLPTLHDASTGEQTERRTLMVKALLA